jgi:hypothetical protein
MALQVVVKHVDEVLQLQLPPQTTFGKLSMPLSLIVSPLLPSSGELKLNLATLTGIPVDNQKLLGRGVAPSTPLDTMLEAIATKNTIKLMLLGSHPDVVQKVRPGLPCLVLDLILRR